MDKIDIRTKSGAIRFSTPVNEGSKRKYLLQSEDSVTLKFSAEQPIYFRLGDYIKIPNDPVGIFELTSLYSPAFNYETGGYDYELRLDAYYYKWKNKIFKYSPENGGREASWNLTASLDVQLGVFLRNLKSFGYKYNGKDFKFNIDNTVENKSLLVSYENTNMIDALTKLAETWECEWWVRNNIIYFGKCVIDAPVNFELGVNVEKMSSTRGQNTHATRLYVFGSSRNLPTNYRPLVENAVINGVVQKRLMLPEDTPHIDAYEGMNEEEAIESVVVFDDIYPRRVGTIGAGITTKEYTESKDNEDGSKTKTKWNAYRFKDSGIEFLKEYILPGQELKITFQSGLLNGMEFNVLFNPDNHPEKNGGVINPDAQLWEVVRNENYGRPLPDDVFKPKEGDKYVLSGFNIKLVSDSFISAAENELKARALKYIEKTKLDPSTYDVTLMSNESKYFYDAGQRVNLINPTYFENGRISRIIGFELNLDIPSDSPVYTIGETAAYSKYGELKGEVERLTYKGQLYSGSSGENLYVISRNDNALATDRNVFSAKRSLDEFLNKRIPDIAQEIITFLKGLKFGNGEHGIDKDGLAKLDAIHIGEYVEGVSGAALKEINGQTYLEVDKAYFRQKAVFEALEVMKTMYSYGNRIAGKGGVKITRVEEQPNAYRCYFLHEQDGLKIENPFVLNDQALVKEANIKEGTTEHAANHFLWRAVVAVGENYVDLSKTVCASGSDEPLPGDALCQLGYRGTDKPDRQCAIMERTVGEDVPAYVMLQGINDFTLEGKDILSYGWDATKKRAYMKNYGETYVGSRDRKQFIEYTPEDGLRVNAKEVHVEVKGQPTSVGQTMSEIATKTDEISLTVKNRKFGGVNLLKGTAFEKLPQKNAVRLSLGNDPAVCHNKRNYIKASASGFSSSSSTGIFLYASQVEKNTEYTYSVWVRVDDLSALDAGLYFEVFATKGADGTRIADIVGKFLVPSDAGKWVRVVNTFTTPNIDFDALEVTAIVIKNGTAYFSEPQLEVGNVPTDWSENPDDVKDQIEEAGVKIKQGLIELNGKSVFKNGNAPAVPLFDENGKVNPKLSTAQYLMNVLRNMETMIDGGLVIAGLMAAKDGEQVTAYLNGLRQKTHALAAGVKNFGTENETTVSHINFDGSAKFGNLGISADGRVNIIDAAGKPRINITPDELPSDDELLKTADENKTYNLPIISKVLDIWHQNVNWEAPMLTQKFKVLNNLSHVKLEATINIGSDIDNDLVNGIATNASCYIWLNRVTGTDDELVGYYGESHAYVENGVPAPYPNISGKSITERKKISQDFTLYAGEWQIEVRPLRGEKVHNLRLSLENIKVEVSFKSGRQNFSLAHNGFASVNSNHQAAYIRDGKLHAFGEMNIPGILLAGTVSSGGILSNAWGEFAAGTGLTYNDAGGVQVIRLTFTKPLPCGSNYVVSVVPNEDGAIYGCMAVVRRKTERYCELRVVNDSGGEVGDVGLDFIVVGRNK